MKYWRAFCLPVAAILIAELAFRQFFADSDVFAPPSAVFMGAIRALADGTMLSSTRDTLLAALGGLVVGAVPGIAAGVCLGLSRFASAAAFLSLEILRPVPAVALIPLAMLLFGFGYGMEIAIVAFATFWPAVILSKHAIEEIPAVLVEASRSLCLSRLRQFFSIILPAAAPRLFSGLRFCIGYAIVVAVTVEIFSNPQGLGYALIISQQTLHPDLMLAMLLWVGIVGWSLNAGLLKLQSSLYAHRVREGRQA
ncbi:ABC-type nitrate/sulfonate/bicarbonate transport system permease component [Bradyrhizobium sp. USDA 4341]